MAAVNVTFPGNLAQVKTANDLRSVPSTLLPLGALFLVNGLEGLFEYDPGSVEADDGKDVLRPYDKTPGQVGRWLRNVDGLATGPEGPTGPANSTYTTLAGLKAADTTNVSAIYDGSLWFWTLGNYAGKADDATIVQSNGAPLTTGAWVRQVNAILRPAMFGAKGDGVTNDNAAFRTMTGIVNALGGGVTIDLEGKTYIVGAQEFAGATGKGYAYRPLHTMFFSGCTKPVTVAGNGAKIKYASGLHFGAFDPVTGQPKTGISTNQDFRADAGYTIIGFNCPGGLIVYDVELDGNVDGFTLGGFFGDTGYQLGHYGLYWETTRGQADNVYAHHFCLDGFGISHPGCTVMTAPLPVEMNKCRADYNCRQGLSLVGGKGHRISNSEFTNTGKGRFSSAPSAGIDIEAEQAVVRDILIDVCTIANNVGVGIVADSGDIADVKVADSNIFGTQAPGSNSYSVWPNKPRMVFDNCRFSGTALSNYDAQTPGDANLFRKCIFYSVRWLNLQPFGLGLIDASTNGRYEVCQFYAFDPSIHLGASNGRNQFTNCTFIQNGSTDTSNIRGRFFGDTSFTITTGQCDWGGSVSMNLGQLQYTGALINVPAVAGEVGASSNTILRRFTLGNKAGAYIKRISIAWDSPTSAVNAFGPLDEVVNTNPAIGAAPSWVSIGGTMTRTGIIGSQQATGLTSSSSAADIVAALKAANLAS